MTSSDEYILVAAIDFGTTFSGYAFSSKFDFKKDPLKIHANQAWSSGGKNLASLKTATALLLNENGKFESFGFDAETSYANYMLDGKHLNHYFFHRFKMKLYNNKDLSKDMMIEDIAGRKFSALKVFSLSIEALKKHLLDTLSKQGLDIGEPEIRWVLTVPAIWNDSAKQFMRLAAKEAGITPENLRIALEPEAASICCQHLPVERKSAQFSVYSVGTKYMVVDLGGGTADITVHEKLEGDKLRELYKSSGGACGGTSVDQQFFQLLTRIIGAPIIRTLHKKNTMAYFDLLKEFESAKRTIKPSTQGKVSITIPYVALDSLLLDAGDENLVSVVKECSLSADVSLTGDKLRINSELMKNLFHKSCEETVDHLKNIMNNFKGEISRFLMVGGFSESPMIINAIEKAFPSVRLIIPADPGLAVLKGAVIFGHQSDTIVSRVMKYSYGVRTTPDFNKTKHNPNKMFKEGNNERCADVFSAFVKAGTSVPVGHKCVQAYTTTRPFQDSMPIMIYFSTDSLPKYTTDDCCQKLGTLDVSIPKPSAEDHHVAVQYVFGDTELKVLAVEIDSMMPCAGEFHLI